MRVLKTEEVLLCTTPWVLQGKGMNSVTYHREWNNLSRTLCVVIEIQKPVLSQQCSYSGFCEMHVTIHICEGTGRKLYVSQSLQSPCVGKKENQNCSLQFLLVPTNRSDSVIVDE